MEPPPWYFPTRQALGAVLLEGGRAGEAEAVYRADLDEWPKNGWSLFGLSQCARRAEEGRRGGLGGAGLRARLGRART